MIRYTYRLKNGDRITINTQIGNEGTGFYRTDPQYRYESGLLIYLSQVTDRSVDETYKDLIEGTDMLWQSN